MVNVYVLKSLFEGILYVGISMDIDRRIKEHNLGRSKFTSGHVPWELVYKEEMPDFKTARVREKFLKSASGKRFLASQGIKSGSNQ